MRAAVATRVTNKLGGPVHRVSAMAFGRAAVSNYLPIMLGGCVGYWDAWVGPTLSGTTVTAWKDQSGSNDGTAVGSPTIAYQSVNGAPTIHFVQGSSQAFTLPNSYSALTSAEIFFVLVSPNAALGPSIHNFHNDTVSNTQNLFPFSDNAIYDNFGSTTRQSTGVPASPLTTYRLYNVRSAASAWSSFLDGAQQFSTGTNTFGIGTTPALAKCTSLPGAVDRFYDGDIALIFMFSRVLVSQERLAVQAFVRSRLLPAAYA